jgi:hypothetical protein
VAIVSEAGTVVRHRRTEIRASREHPGDEVIHDLGFSAFPGGRWHEEPAGWRMAVAPVTADAVSGAARPARPGFALR